jgi:hypothetical protein
VPSYRMYFLNDEGRIVDFIEHACEDDPGALDTARALESQIEIWQARRRVALVKPGRDTLLFDNPRAN